MKINTITTDMIVGFGLVIALILSIALGSGSEIQTTLGAGLVGYIGRVANETVHQKSMTEEFTKKVSEAVLKQVTEHLSNSDNPVLKKVETVVSNPIIKGTIEKELSAATDKLLGKAAQGLNGGLNKDGKN